MATGTSEAKTDVTCSSLERALDDAMERHSSAPLGAQLVSHAAPAHAVASTLAAQGATIRLNRLHWNGVAVSDEFQHYAERVASGEELGPYRGRVLAPPHRDLPWSVAHPSQPRSRRRHLGAPLSKWLTALSARQRP